MEIEIRITDPRIGNDFPLPDYATDGSAGKDLCACLDKPVNIAPAETAVIGTGIAIFINNPDYMAFMRRVPGWASSTALCWPIPSALLIRIIKTK